MKAGNYYVGDLCYVLHDVWGEAVEIMFDKNGTGNEGEFTLKDGRKFAIYGTRYGDGTYRDNLGWTYSVDSGSIGCILDSDINRNDLSNYDDLGNVIEFKDNFETSSDGALLQFGHVIIDTGYDGEESDGQPDESQEWNDYDPDC